MRLRLAIALAVVALGACKCPGTAPAAVDAGHSAADDAAAAFGDEPVRPVYDLTTAAEPRAKRLCDALYTASENRRDACCHTAPAPSAAGICAGTLSSALHFGGVALDEAALAHCEAAVAAENRGCDTVGPFRLPPPPECMAALTARLPAGAKCRSSLECQGSLRCQGSGPTDLGVCGSPRTTGTCNTAIDALAGMLRMDIEHAHPPCAGFCDRNHCIAAKALGDNCKIDSQCPLDMHCAAGKCAAGVTAALGAPCTGACPSGARCIEGVCAIPKPSGASCSAPVECQGTCLVGDRGSVCGMGCGKDDFTNWGHR